MPNITPIDPVIVPKLVIFPVAPPIATPLSIPEIDAPVEPFVPLATLPPAARRIPSLDVPVLSIVPKLVTAPAAPLIPTPFNAPAIRAPLDLLAPFLMLPPD